MGGFNPLTAIKTVMDYAKPDPAPKPSAPPSIIQGGTYKSMADMQARGYEKDKKISEFAAARQLKDPSKAPTPMLRVQAVNGKLERILSNPNYAKITPENREKVLGVFYDKYVPQAMKNAGIDPPTKEEWLSRRNAQSQYDKSSAKPTESRLLTGGTELMKGYADTVRIAGNLVKYTLGEGAPKAAGFNPEGAGSKYVRAVDKKIFEYADAVTKVATDYESTFNTRHDPVSWLSNFAGRVLGDAPAYMAASEIGGGIKVAETVPTLAEKAAVSKGMQVAVHSLRNATEVMGVTKAEGHSNIEVAEAGIGALLLTAPLHALALRFKSSQLAVGGEPFADKVANNASRGEDVPIKHSPEALVNPSDPDFRAAVKGEQELREKFAREFHPEKAEAAGDKSVWRNLSKGQRTKIVQHLDATTKQAAELMPLVNPEVQTTANLKTIVEAIKDNPMQAQRMQAIQKLTGLNPAEVLTKMQAKEVGQKTGLTSPAKTLQDSFSEKGISEQLPKDLRKSAPRYRDKRLNFEDPRDLALYTVARDFTKPEVQSASHGKFLSYLRNQFPDKSDAHFQVTAGREVRAKVKELAHNTEGDVVNIPKLHSLDRQEQHFPTGDIFGADRSAGARTVSNASLLNPKMSTEDFVKGTQKYLEDNPATKSGKDYFENPEHHLLWVANFSDASSQIKNRAFEILRKDFNLSREQAGNTKAGGWLANFRNDLARTGHLYTEGNIYRSTKNTQRRYATKWQKEVLEPESEASDMKAIAAITKRHPELKDTFDALNHELTKLKNKSATPITEKLRRSTQDRIVDLMQRYK